MKSRGEYRVMRKCRSVNKSERNMWWEQNGESAVYGRRKIE
jgi:hypothetical protein